MNPSAVFLVLVLSLSLLAPATGEIPATPVANINDAAAFLAGVELPHQQEHPLAATSSWTSHATQMDKDFAAHQERVLFPMSSWAAAEVAPAQAPGDVVRYLFSGPDMIHAFHMYPTAGTYILCGLEPVGQAPDITELNEGNAARALGEVRNALSAIINLSFFRTLDMKEDLQFATFQGTTPIIMIFLARSGQYFKEVEFLKLQKEGTLLSQGLDHKGADVVKMVFSPRRLEQDKTLYYFSTDLSDGGFDRSGFGTWISAQPKGNSYLKAASYLMHDGWFSKVRQHLLDYSHQIAQDDSGIPYRFFDAETWQTHLYGVYTGPIELFAKSMQPDLAAAYATKGAGPLPFGTGYKWRRGESNLMRFVRHGAPLRPLEPSTEETPARDASEIPRTSLEE